MTASTLRPVPRPTPPRAEPPSGSPLRAGFGAALWALVVGLAAVGFPVLLVWATDGRSAAGTGHAVRAAGQLWLVAHGAPLALPDGHLSLLPLGLLVLPLGLLVRAGSTAARQYRVTDLRGAGLLAAAVAGPYALGAGAVAAACGTSWARPSVVGAVGATSLVALLGAGTGVVRTSALDGALHRAVPEPVRRLLLPAAAVVAVLLAAGALLAGLELALHAGRAADVARSTQPGVVGGTALLVLGLGLVPDVAVWGASWFAGTGFSLGTGTGLSPFAHDVGPLPALPLAAAVPAHGLTPELGALALLVPVLAGVLAGLLVGRQGGRRPVVDAALCGPLAGAGIALLALVTSGAAGGGRMADLGASWWQTGLAVAVEVAVPAAATAWLRGRLLQA